MTTQNIPISNLDQYIAAFEALEQNGAAQDPAWLRQLRLDAFHRFTELGFPTARRGNEEWKYTDVGPLAKTAFQSLPSTAAPVLDFQSVQPFTYGGATGNRIVFVNGAYSESLSSTARHPENLTLAPFSQALAPDGDLVRRYLGQNADYAEQAFVALNTAFLHDGALVHVPEGAVVKEPVLILHLTADGQEIVTHPRTLVVAEKDSKVTILESYGGLASGAYFTNAVTEIILEPGAEVHHYRMQRQSEQAYHVATTSVNLSEGSSYTSVALDMGGKLTRNNLNALVAGEGASCVLNGAYLVTGQQHVDNQVIIDHASPYTTSRELYKGVLDGRSQAVFHGSIIVRRGAQKVDAKQEDRNLLLSDHCEADTRPAFWIYADDVKCAHGASSGKLDDDALFYLKSRGLDEQESRSLLTKGFVHDITATIAHESIRAHTEAAVSAWLEKL
jgi:Fe-S cluster assembly protein SufD